MLSRLIQLSDRSIWLHLQRTPEAMSYLCGDIKPGASAANPQMIFL
jgi:hypothetical protein